MSRRSRTVDAVVDLGVDPLVDLVDLGAQRLRVELRSTVAVIGRPLGRQVQCHLREVVSDHSSARHVDDRGDSDALRIVGEAGEVRVLQTGNLQHRVDAAGVEIESPAALVMGWPAKPNGENIFQSQQPPDDDRAVGPRAGSRDDQPIPARLHRVAVAAVGGDPGFDVFGVAGEFAGLGDVSQAYLPGCLITADWIVKWGKVFLRSDVRQRFSSCAQSPQNDGGVYRC